MVAIGASNRRGGVGDASRGIYTTSAAGLDKHLPISDYRRSMYTSLVALIALAVCALAAPAEDVIPIVSQSQEGPNPDGSYKWSYESGNGIKAEEEGHLEDAGSENEAMSAQGAFSYPSDDGQSISLTYVADKNGFQPVGAHLPTTPEIPALIQRALEWNAAHPSKDDENQV
ncbi:endocuticle structural glycoprotein SgAbd-4-like [Odontomachus brunneus]|uniref:endocuticle structural glycoprotein SgAbd-4-like n=1 Tax=Odontomachus brunneus TaxID=486640 RepID=UPI0013F29C98|nr:endocuticle structural glycoprotein SgAbd-4-like [Odontomachus brunneus]